MIPVSVHIDTIAAASAASTALPPCAATATPACGTGSPHIAIETYTWPILVADTLDRTERRHALIDGVVRELRWTKRTMVGGQRR